MKAGWKLRPLGEVCNLLNGRAYKRAELLDTGKYPVLRVGNFFTNDHWYYSDLELDANKYCDDGDLLYAWSASFGPRIWKGGKVIYHYHIWKVVPEVGQLDRDFLHHFFDWDKELIKKDQGAGTTMMHVSKGSMEARSIPLPPIEEQQRIVAVLDDAFAGLARARAHAEANLQNARQLFESFLGTVFSKGADGWRSAPLQQLVEEDCSLSYGIVQPGDEVSEGLPIVRPTDLGERIVTLNGLKRIDPVNAQGYGRTNLKGNEILLCVRGSTGVVSLASEELAGANVTRGIVPIRFEPSVVNQQFGYYQFLSKPVQDQIRAGTYGAALMQINIRDLRQMVFVVPPVAQQDDLVQRLSSVSDDFDRLVENYEHKVSEIDDLRKSLLQKAFAGELT
ncbi:MAG: restriction endonuclease subunit S [Mesorhizobium sp.]|uniref:restriction endonuclease subunit S n=1 Tax=unclassified Mesorhizobium TaxID=325217 RepID=UPI000FCA3B2A|nr:MULTISPECIES: restriction endonuclease subunit S [unclassified Mesorhizobium]RVD66570.1 restriction endonuclease subunit S [Mesorhizobium sp. M7A.F.Ca.ET.027.03.2.1]RWP84175.1 MAG: restriction endonuclease subunit S [Mesorhizobium sp.]